MTVGAGLWGAAATLGPTGSDLWDDDTHFDLSDMRVGEKRLIQHFDTPIYVAKLTDQDLESLRSDNPLHLPDPLARNGNLSNDAVANLENRSSLTDRSIVVLDGRCPRLGCVPLADAGDYSGWFCPCGGAHFDGLGRIRKGPTAENLRIPRFALDAQLQLTLFADQTVPSMKAVDGLLHGKGG